MDPKQSETRKRNLPGIISPSIKLSLSQIETKSKESYKLNTPELWERLYGKEKLVEDLDSVNPGIIDDIKKLTLKAINEEATFQKSVKMLEPPSKKK
ncbi:MAG: hypothetical protein QXG00_07795 [Candidatus Woesearchaeota archaeon]